MNLNLYGHAGKWLMVDCGVSFDEPLIAPYLDNANEPQTHRVVCADPKFIASQRDSIAGICISHAHEDHIGALADLWTRFQAPVYCTPFTAEILRRKLGEKGLDGKVPVHIVALDSHLLVGPFSVSWITLTHSIPEPSALLIQTAAGNVLHTADWKIDLSPALGQPFDKHRLSQLSDLPLLAVIGDSTNATKSGMSVSESASHNGLLATIKPLRGRVVVACFASNIARLIGLAKIAAQTGRYMFVFGRSLENMVSAARVTGLWPDDIELADPQHAGYLPPEEVLVVATGSQGERRAALSRLARDAHPWLSLDKDDTVIFSSIIIPGNELPIAALDSQFKQRGIRVIHSETHTMPIHASGHPCAQELQALYQMTQPQIAVPTHGEHAHLMAHANIAKEQGVRKTFVGKIGDLFRLAPQPSVRRNWVKTGRLALQRN